MHRIESNVQTGEITVIPFTAEELAAYEVAKVAADAKAAVDAETNRIAALWKAAHDYEYKEISGSAIGLLALGVGQGKPKCVAVMGWIQSIWTEYYTRKAGTSSDTDYSSCGACPYSVPELMAELGV